MLCQITCGFLGICQIQIAQVFFYRWNYVAEIVASLYCCLYRRRNTLVNFAMGFSNCLICFSDLTVVDSSDLETLRTGITNQSMKEFLEEHLLIELDVSSFGSARICDECKVRVDCLEEALVQAKEMKLQLLNDFERSLQKRTEESHIEEDDDCLELVDTLSTDPPSPMIEVNVIATDATETNNDEIQIADKVPSPSESQDQEYANFWFSDTIDSKFACHTCGVKYHSRHSLKSHILTKHLDVGRICCLVCGKFFNQKGSLKKHMRIHTRERNFQVKMMFRICLSVSGNNLNFTFIRCSATYADEDSSMRLH